MRRRTRGVQRFPAERSALVLIRASIEQDRLKSRGVEVTPELVEAAQAAAAPAREPLVLECPRECLDAA